MVLDMFGSLLEDLGKAIGISGLTPDSHNSCLIQFKHDIQVQLELDRTGNFLVIVTDFGPIQEGRFRDDLFRQALKANNVPYPRYGTFAYSKKAEHFVLFKQYNLKDLTGARVADYLGHFLEKAKSWKQAIDNQQVPALDTRSYGASSGLFGLIR